MLFLVPQGQFQKHLHTLANIAKLLHKAEFREALESAADADTMLAIIREHDKSRFPVRMEFHPGSCDAPIFNPRRHKSK